ncbi:hypothetical protein VTK26DRAFT_2256 [Humicola hyalothermophila]
MERKDGDPPPPVDRSTNDANGVDNNTSPGAPSAASQSAAATSASGAARNSIPAHIHQTWTPKYGRIAKCDICDKRSPGCLQLCMTCQSRTICENCARSGNWQKDKDHHFIDPDACDWTIKKPAKRQKQFQGTGQPASASSSYSNEGRPARRRKLDHGVQDDASFEGNGNDSRQDGENASNRSPTSTLTAVASPAQVSTPDSLSAGRHTTLITAAATRPNVREAAARALEGMSQQTRRPNRAAFVGNVDADVQANNADNHDDDGDDDETEDEDDDEEKGEDDHVNKTRNPVHRRGNRAPRANIAGTRRAFPQVHNSNPLAVAGPHPGTPNSHERLIVNIYHNIYGSRPEMDFPRARTTIPDYWDGNWPNMPHFTAQQPNPWAPGAHPYGMPHSVLTHEQYHQEVFASTARHDPNLPSAPLPFALLLLSPLFTPRFFLSSPIFDTHTFHLKYLETKAWNKTQLTTLCLIHRRTQMQITTRAHAPPRVSTPSTSSPRQSAS